MSEVEVTEIKKTVVKWGTLEAHIVRGELQINPEMPEGTRLLIQNDPQGFVGFCAAIARILEATKPPEPRKTRSDKGIAKTKLTAPKALKL